MNKIINYKKFITLSLLVVFISPLLIKATHFLYVHHEPRYISKSDQPEVYKKHKTCSICAFKFVQFTANKKPQTTYKPLFFLVYKATYSPNIYLTKSSYSFNLRAPPVNS